MTKQIDRPEGHPTQEPIFVPKQEGQVALGLDECLDLIVKAQEERAALQKRLDNLKGVAKTILKAKGLEKYENEKGRKAQWFDSQRANYDKELLKELLGDDFARCVSFSTVKSFKVT